MKTNTIIETDYMVLVNKKNKLPNNWENIVELVDTKDAWNEVVKVEREAFINYCKLKESLKKENIYIEIDSAYRSVVEQENIWNSFESEYGTDYVKKYVAIPGYSEHHTGLAIDICIKKDGDLIFENSEMLKEEEIFLKIHKRLSRYGFILRYPKDKEYITGYGYEPWHFRYIKNIKIAKEIMNNNLTLEEYLINKI